MAAAPGRRTSAASASTRSRARSRLAPAGAFYLVLTHRHDLDLRISTEILAPRRLRLVRPDRLAHQARALRPRVRASRHPRRDHRADDLPDRHRRHQRQGTGNHRCVGGRATAAGIEPGTAIAAGADRGRTAASMPVLNVARRTSHPRPVAPHTARGHEAVLRRPGPAGDLARRRPAGPVAGNARPRAGHAGGRAARERRLGLGGQVRRLPHPRAHRGRRGPAADAKRQGLDRATRRDRGRTCPSAARIGLARRRDRGPRRRRRVRLRRAAERLRRRRRAHPLLRLRHSLSRRPRPARSADGGTARDPARPARRGRRRGCATARTRAPTPPSSCATPAASGSRA